jgi:hypothetical protein
VDTAARARGARPTGRFESPVRMAPEWSPYAPGVRTPLGIIFLRPGLRNDELGSGIKIGNCKECDGTGRRRCSVTLRFAAAARGGLVPVSCS